MNLNVPSSFIKQVIKNGNTKKALADLTKWSADTDLIGVDTGLFRPEDIELLEKLAEKHAGEKGVRGLMQKLTTFKGVQSDVVSKVIKRLEPYGEALKNLIAPLPHRWLFYANDGKALPYYVRSIEFHESYMENGYFVAAHTDVNLEYCGRGGKDRSKIVFGQEDLNAGTVLECLNAKGWYFETAVMVSQYEKDCIKHKEIHLLRGRQFLAFGKGELTGSGRYHGDHYFGKEGNAAKVVMDDSHDAKGRDDDDDGDEIVNIRDAYSSDAFWKGVGTTSGTRKSRRSVVDLDDEAAESVQKVLLPFHPYVSVFDLDAHEFGTIHVSQLDLYKFNNELGSKLILAEDKKALIEILVRGAGEVMEDIIEGKTGGVILISTGPPGTGKTLSAEIYSEVIERPLYVVQCSQLGTDEEEVEKELQVVLDRASRWGAILLIDEADVYIHTRGEDIQQNAIVGVFLRLLEKYRGVMFLTSNRDTVIDDAILSRATAHIRYAMPTPEELTQIWEVLGKQYQLNLSSALINKLVREWPNLSGRNVKTLLKLVNMVIKGSKKPPVFEDFNKVFQFIDVFDVEGAKKKE